MPNLNQFLTRTWEKALPVSLARTKAEAADERGNYPDGADATNPHSAAIGGTVALIDDNPATMTVNGDEITIRVAGATFTGTATQFGALDAVTADLKQSELMKPKYRAAFRQIAAEAGYNLEEAAGE